MCVVHGQLGTWGSKTGLDSALPNPTMPPLSLWLVPGAKDSLKESTLFCSSYIAWMFSELPCKWVGFVLGRKSFVVSVQKAAPGSSPARSV